jgi:hypothetical protein
MPLFYILDTRQIIGNEALWWCPNRAGYTTNLDEAGQYTEEQTKGLRPTDIPVPVEVAKRLAHASVFSDHLLAEGFKKPKEPYRPTRCAWCPRFVSRHSWLCRKCEDAKVYR